MTNTSKSFTSFFSHWDEAYGASSDVQRKAKMGIG